nr:MAG TPA: hypothetical protein [Caudoviricetes sp.]
MIIEKNECAESRGIHRHIYATQDILHARFNYKSKSNLPKMVVVLTAIAPFRCFFYI